MTPTDDGTRRDKQPRTDDPSGDVAPTLLERAAHQAIAHDLFCQNCGYNLRTLTSDRCPECGYSLETVRSEICTIPWVHREKLGRFRAYWQTVFLVMFRQRWFCDEMARPVIFGDSQRFRWVTVLYCYLPLLAAGVALHLIEPGLGSAGVMPTSWLDQVVAYPWLVALLYDALFLFFAMATGLPSYFFHPRGVPIEQQNRAIALSYYACGPLAVTVVPATSGVVAAALGPDRSLGLFFLLLAVLLPLALFAAWWLDVIHLTLRILPQRKARAVLVAVMVPVLWQLAALVAMVGLPLAAWYVALIVYSVSHR